MCGGRRRRPGGQEWAEHGRPVCPGLQEMVMLEIEVMNLLNHRNLIQLYAAMETAHDLVLFLE